MKITAIWRYPVKTMAGEQLERAVVGSLGIEGDRIVHVEDSKGRVILLLQEMHETAVATIADRLRMGYVYYPATLHPIQGHHVGNAILSRWPIAEDRKVVLPRPARLIGTGRVAVVATVTVRGQRLRIYSLHLATSFAVGEGGIEEQLRVVIADAKGSPDPVLIGGDFNSSTVGRLLVADGYRWLTQHVGPTAWIHSIDHVFTKGLPATTPEAGAVRADDLPSDHRPVWAVIQDD